MSGLMNVVIFYGEIIIGISLFVLLGKRQSLKMIKDNTFESEMIWYSNRIIIFIFIISLINSSKFI